MIAYFFYLVVYFEVVWVCRAIHVSLFLKIFFIFLNCFDMLMVNLIFKK